MQQDKWVEIVSLAQQQAALPANLRNSSYLLQLFDEFENLIQSPCRRFRVDPSERRDVLQESYLGFIKAVYTFDPSLGHTFAGYAKSKTKQAVWQYMRVRNRNRSREQSDVQISDEGAGVSLIDSLVDSQTFDSFSELEWRSLLTSLSEREALAVQKIVIDGMTMADLARMEGVSPDTVKTWKQRAFVKIREELKKIR